MDARELALYRYIKNKASTKTGRLDKQKMKYFSGFEILSKIMDKEEKLLSKLHITHRNDLILMMKSLARKEIIIRVERKLEELNERKKNKLQERLARHSNDPDYDHNIEQYKISRLFVHSEKDVYLDTADSFYCLAYDEPNNYINLLVALAIVTAIIGYYLAPFFPEYMAWVLPTIGYLSASVLILFISVFLIKYFLFFLVFLLSGMKIRFWLLPNLTEDCGFFDSFKPLYRITSKATNKISSDEEILDGTSDKNNLRSNDKNLNKDKYLRSNCFSASISTPITPITNKKFSQQDNSERKSCEELRKCEFISKEDFTNQLDESSNLCSNDGNNADDEMTSQSNTKN